MFILLREDTDNMLGGTHAVCLCSTREIAVQKRLEKIRVELQDGKSIAFVKKTHPEIFDGDNKLLQTLTVDELEQAFEDCCDAVFRIEELELDAGNVGTASDTAAAALPSASTLQKELDELKQSFANREAIYEEEKKSMRDAALTLMEEKEALIKELAAFKKQHSFEVKKSQKRHAEQSPQ